MRRTRFSNPEHIWLLSSPSWSVCEGLIKAFEEAWRRGQAPVITDYLRADGPEFGHARSEGSLMSVAEAAGLDAR